MDRIPTPRELYAELCEESAPRRRPPSCPSPRPRPALPDVLGEVARAFGVEYEALMGRSRSTAIVAARHAAMLILRERYALSLPVIGALLGRDHTTVIHGLAAAATRRRHDAAYAARLAALLPQGGAS